MLWCEVNLTECLRLRGTVRLSRAEKQNQDGRKSDASLRIINTTKQNDAYLHEK